MARIQRRATELRRDVIAYEQITGEAFAPDPSPPLPRIAAHLGIGAAR